MLSSSTRPGLRRAPLQSAAGPIFDAAPRRNIAKSPLRTGAAGQSASGVRSRDNCAAAPTSEVWQDVCRRRISRPTQVGRCSSRGVGRSTACRPAEQSGDRMPDADRPHASPRPRVAGLRFRRIRPSGRGWRGCRRGRRWRCGGRRRGRRPGSGRPTPIFAAIGLFITTIICDWTLAAHADARGSSSAHSSSPRHHGAKISEPRRDHLVDDQVEAGGGLPHLLHHQLVNPAVAAGARRAAGRCARRSPAAPPRVGLCRPASSPRSCRA